MNNYTIRKWAACLIFLIGCSMANALVYLTELRHFTFSASPISSNSTIDGFFQHEGWVKNAAISANHRYAAYERQLFFDRELAIITVVAALAVFPQRKE